MRWFFFVSFKLQIVSFTQFQKSWQPQCADSESRMGVDMSGVSWQRDTQTTQPVNHQLHCTCDAAEAKTRLIVENSMKANTHSNCQFISFFTKPALRHVLPSSFCWLRRVVLCFQSRLALHRQGHLNESKPSLSRGGWPLTLCLLKSRLCGSQEPHAVRRRINSTFKTTFGTVMTPEV